MDYGGKTGETSHLTGYPYLVARGRDTAVPKSTTWWQEILGRPSVGSLIARPPVSVGRFRHFFRMNPDSFLRVGKS